MTPGAIVPRFQISRSRVFRSSFFGLRLVPSRAVERKDNTAIILFAMCLGVFIAQLDSTVVYLAVKHIGNDLNARISTLQWVLDGYNLGYAAFLLTGGTLGDLFGRTRVFVIGIALIAAGSLLCALAPNGAMLVAGRAVTGLGSALEVPTSLAILAIYFDELRARSRAIGIWASCNGLTMATGPSLGGLLVDSFGWRSIFYMVIPVCALGIAIALRYVGESRHPQGRHLDLPGQTLAVIALGSLSFMVIEGPHRGAASAMSLSAAAVALLAVALFRTIEAGKPGAMVPFDLFANAPFNAALAIAGLMTFGMYAMMFLMPHYLQAIGGASAFAAGLALMPMSIIFVVVSQLSGALTGRYGARGMMAGGMGCMGARLLMLTAIALHTSLVWIEAAFIVIGVGLGLNTGPVNAVAVASVPPARSGTAAGLVNTARMIGATLGIAVLGAAYSVFARHGTPTAMISGFRLALAGGTVAELSGAMLALRFVREDSATQKRH